LRYLLDTNIISELRKGSRADRNVLAWISNMDAEDIGTSVVILGETRRGIELKRRNDMIQAQAMDLWFDRMRSGLRDRVTPIDETIADQ
jgi:predicted nucleic acid-binding protein